MANAKQVSIASAPYNHLETIPIGPLTMYVLEDGSNTDNRIGTVVLQLPPHTPGPPEHWHEMHDETFFVTKGVVRFHTGEKTIDAKVGDYVVVPPTATHTFENATGEEAEFVNTLTPAFYVNYFRLLGEMGQKSGGNISPEDHKRAMDRYATLQVDAYGDFEPGGGLKKGPVV